MARLSGWALPQLAAFLVTALGFLRPAVAQIKVISPRALAKQFKDGGGKINGATATFGAPFYGDRVLGRLVYSPPKADAHCTEEDYDVPAPEEQLRAGSTYKEVRLINIVMVRRGKCSFTTKVKVAYAKGAHAVIIVDKEDSKLSAAEIRRIIVSDDGFGNGIHIPSILISKQDGASLIEASKGSSPVIVELEWDVPTNHIVTMDLWMSSASKESNKFLKAFAPHRRVLNEVMHFRPHYAVFAMPKGDPSVYNEMCSDSTGQYCAEDPDGAGLVTGKDVLEENIRQLCIHELTKVKQAPREIPVSAPAAGLIPQTGLIVEYADKYWAYVEKLLDSCPLDAANEQDRFGRHCAERLMGEIGLDVPAIQECYLSTRSEKLKFQLENVAWSPRALRINGWRYDGILDADLVTRAVCAGFLNTPMECKLLINERDPFSASIPAVNVLGGGINFGSVVGILIAMGLIGSIIMLVYKRYLKESVHSQIREEVMLEVQSQMGAYTQMGNGA